MQGEAVYLTAFDAGAELDLSRIPTLLGQVPAPAPLVARAPTPRNVAFPAPLAVHQDLIKATAQGDTVRLEVRVHALGTVVVRFRVPFEVADLQALHAFDEALDVHGDRLPEAAERVAKEVLASLGPARLDPYDTTSGPEPYMAYVLHTDAPAPEALLAEERRELAALIADEPRSQRLSDEAIEASLRYTLRYYRDDLVAVGWEKAVIVAAPGEYEDVLDVMELANLELLELRTYDSYLDHRLQASFAALDRLWASGGLFRSARGTLSELSEVRGEVARLTDNLRDTGKLFGEWYLARLHRLMSERFQLPEWERAVEKKMSTLGELFQVAEEEATHRRALVLEAMIVLLFILDLAALVILAK